MRRQAACVVLTRALSNFYALLLSRCSCKCHIYLAISKSVIRCCASTKLQFSFAGVDIITDDQPYHYLHGVSTLVLQA
jgi:hypothetical protein